MTDLNIKSDHEYILSSLSGKVLLIGGYGAGNIGDEAILTGLLQDTSPDIETLSIITHNEDETRRLHESEVPSSVKINPISPSIPTLVNQLYTVDHIVIGGGGIFSRYMGPYASKIPYYILTARLLQNSTYWTAIGVYPSTPLSTMYPLRFAMNQSQSITVRDAVSERTLQKNKVKGVKLVADPATRLEPDIERGQAILDNLEINMSDKIIGIAARRVMNSENNIRLMQAYRGIMDHFASNGWSIIFVPFCKHPYEDLEMDDMVCRKLASESDSATVLSYDHPEELLGVVNQFDAMVATRLHSMIFAHETGIPFAAIEYADKCTSLLRQYRVQSHGIPLEEVTAEKITSTIYDQL